MQKRIKDALNSLRNRKPQESPILRPRNTVTIDMTGIDGLPDEEKLKIFNAALTKAVEEGKGTIANPNKKPPYIETGEIVREKFGVSLNLEELKAQGEFRASHLQYFTELLSSGGIEKAGEQYKVTELQADGIRKYSITLIETPTEKFTCELEITSTPGRSDYQVFHSFRGSTYVSTLEGGNVRLEIFVDENGEAHYDVQQLEG